MGKSATFVKVDHVIQETKNLMNIISKVVSTCFDCANKVRAFLYYFSPPLLSFPSHFLLLHVVLTMTFIYWVISILCDEEKRNCLNFLQIYIKSIFHISQNSFSIIFPPPPHLYTQQFLFLYFFLFFLFFFLLFTFLLPGYYRYRKRKLSFLLSVMVDGIWIQLNCFNHCL